MRIVKFEMDDIVTWGVAYEDTVIPVASDFYSLLNAVPLNGKGLPLDSLKLLAPLPDRPKIIGLGYNYRTHKKNYRKAKYPMTIFLKPYTTISNPRADVPVPSFVDKIDYEGELGVVIGKKGRFIGRAEALNYVMGYVVVNDLSARGLQFGDGQWTRGKGLDGFAPVGPWIVSTDELGDASGLGLKTYVNNNVRQDSLTSDMILDVPSIISEISYIMTLEPGDLIATGTPGGTGYFSKPQSFLSDGDIVRIEIERIGYIENTIRFVQVEGSPVTI